MSAAAWSSLVYHADVGGKSTPFANDLVTQCFGSSHAATALTADWQRQLTKVKNEIGTQFVRFHGLLDDDMSVVIKRKNIPTQPKNGTGVPLVSSRGKPCTFVPHQDYHDPGAFVVNASTKEECCAACYNDPTGLATPCIAAVWTPSGRCYSKLSTTNPVAKPTSGVVACVTDRPSPKGYMFSFGSIFRVFDFLISIDMKPVVELSFMPSLLASDPTEVGFWYRGGHSPPKDFNEWRFLISDLTTALIDRYGLAEVKSWYFEVW